MEKNKEDKHLIESAIDGDKNAYGGLVKKYQKRLFRFIFAMLGKKDMTEDIVQDAFVKGYLALGSFDPDKQFYPWIATIARNHAINMIKRSSREKPASEMDEFIISVPDNAPDPLEHFMNKENDRKLMQAIDCLPEQYRITFVLRTFENMSYDEIAKELKISRGTVDSRLFRARKKLVELLKDYL